MYDLEGFSFPPLGPEGGSMYRFSAIEKGKKDMKKKRKDQCVGLSALKICVGFGIHGLEAATVEIASWSI